MIKWTVVLVLCFQIADSFAQSDERTHGGLFCYEELVNDMWIPSCYEDQQQANIWFQIKHDLGLARGRLARHEGPAWCVESTYVDPEGLSWNQPRTRVCHLSQRRAREMFEGMQEYNRRVAYSYRRLQVYRAVFREDSSIFYSE